MALLLWDERIGLVRKHRHARYLAMALCPNRGERKIEANKEKKKSQTFRFQLGNLMFSPVFLKSLENPVRANCDKRFFCFVFGFLKVEMNNQNNSADTIN